jgi:hypothetical protein
MHYYFAMLEYKSLKAVGNETPNLCKHHESNLTTPATVHVRSLHSLELATIGEVR